MRARLYRTVVAALLSPALLVSAGAQGLSLMLCGSAVRVSCCCPAEAPNPSPTTIGKAASECCDKLAVPTVPAQTHDSVPVIASPPSMVVATAGLGLTPATSPVLHAPHLDPPPTPSLVLVN